MDRFSCKSVQSRNWKNGLAAALLMIAIVSLVVYISSFWTGATFELSAIISQHPPQEIIIPLNCSSKDQTQTCPSNYPKNFQTKNRGIPSSQPTCPEYFRWIHEDLRPWKSTGISREMMERAHPTAHFRLIIVDGKAYIQQFRKSYQTRDVYTIWGIVQLLRRYPGKLPDLELMFDCDDSPAIRSSDHRGPKSRTPPPLFAYCGSESTMDIAFPDWSFWGWEEINIKPWDSLLREIKAGNNQTKWIDRVPYAYWKGNAFSGSKSRIDLLTCNVSGQMDWNARIYNLDWSHESSQGFKHSDLASQCTHRYKIYIEGNAWSVSEKYILACDSMTLFVNSKYHDFFTRCLQPMKHYWPIREDNKCKSIKFAVDWGNFNRQKAQEIGKAASKFIQEELKMDYIYDYMFHLLNEYAKLLKFKPKVPDGAVEVCSETMACRANGLQEKFMMETLVKGPSITNPCTMPPYDTKVLASFDRGKFDGMNQVHNLEDKYWESLNILRHN
ncbi:O-glucosyltransferase rumi homolog [Pistacia vera]|uniref:O-glucosyltransferase rumi homolog n=1 Tax=Pistacia vera TaxID=55513 RepID=UPI00126396EE|nr:O-glucosyltransferase rumi homolog [Pistacia vera]